MNTLPLSSLTAAMVLFICAQEYSTALETLKLMDAEGETEVEGKV